MPQAVSDSLSNTNEQIEQAAKAIGRSSLRRQVFEAIYHGKRRVKSASDISRKLGIAQKEVTTAGKHFADRGIVEQVRQEKQTAYKKLDFFHAHKSTILSIATDPVKLQRLPTKRRPIGATSVMVRLDPVRARTAQITIDDIDSFKKVRRITADGFLPRSVSEAQFKKGVQSIIGERGRFQDWGGERSDLLTTRILIDGKRRPTAFAFKGPGKRGPLVPGKMGKNGDQIQRLFESTAEVFLIQYGEEVRENVVDQMQQLAVAKSTMTGKRIEFGVIDGADSNRLYQAYPIAFAKRKKGKK